VTIDFTSRKELKRYLNSEGSLQKELSDEANRIRKESIGNSVYFRGIIEFSNICENDCYYCGIRKSNKNVERYMMTMEEIDECLKFIEKAKYGSVVLQSGEMTYKKAREFILECVKHIHSNYPTMGITLSLGELSYEDLKELKKAGAHRYLLRIETSVPELYRKLHPEYQSLEKRKQCLKDLKSLDYQVGCGNMIGTPGQTDDDILEDLMFFKNEDFDMFGLGPYVIHEDTPLSTPEVCKWWEEEKEHIYQKTLNFISMLRILMPSCNIASATALDVFHSFGRIAALRAGANVIMPSVTPNKYREDYLLYQDKPCIDGNAERCSNCIVRKVKNAKLDPALEVQGNSRHFLDRTNG
jgi:biotin synthase